MISSVPMIRQRFQSAREEILCAAQKVAEASGGILGLGSKVSKSERQVLDEMKQAFP